MPDPQEQNAGVSPVTQTPPPFLSGLRTRPVAQAPASTGGIDLSGLRTRTIQQAQSELPQPQYMAPGEDLFQGTKLGQAYEKAKSWMGEHEQHLSEKYLGPFREGLDRMGSDLQQAGESGHTPSGGQLTGPTRALASGVGSLLKQVPVGRNVRETALAMASPPELGPEWKSLSRELKAGEKAAPNLEGLRAREVSPAPQTEKSWNIHDLNKDHNIPSEPGYVYHATNHDRAQDIADQGLSVHTPSYGTDQEVWPDGSAEKRSYFTGKADSAWQFSPEQGKPALLRMKQDPAIHSRESTGDFYSKKKIPANKLEVLGDDKQWHPISELVSPAPQKSPAPDLSGLRVREVSPAPTAEAKTSTAKELPAQPRLPDTGIHAALKTDDGSIYFDDAPEKQRTHIMLAKDLGIPPERVVSGGWLKDGEYEGSARSDAGKWGDQARAQARVAEKRAGRSAGESSQPAAVEYLHNTQKAPNLGSRFGQDVEPHGKYVTEKTPGSTTPEGWESGKVTFKRPLVVDFGGGYQEASNWKNVLSQKYEGKTGKALSDAIRKDGFDGIITKRDGQTSEIVDLTSAKPGSQTEQPPSAANSPKSIPYSESESARAYHGTSVDAIPSIRKSGITTDKKYGTVWAADTVPEAQRYGLIGVQDYKWDPDTQSKKYNPNAEYAVAVLRVKGSGLKEADGVWRGTQHVPPENIERFDIYNSDGKLVRQEPGVGKQTEQPSLLTPEGAQPLADKLGAKVVGSVAKKGSTPKDLDLRIEGTYDHAATKSKMQDAGFDFQGSSVLSPKEIKESGKDYGAPGWKRIEHFQNKAGNKIDVFHDEPERAPKKSLADRLFDEALARKPQN